MTKLALFDMDGTLANDSARRASYLAGQYSDYWNHEKMMADELFSEAEDAFRKAEAEGCDIMILTARLESYNYHLTAAWLESKGLKVKKMIFRPDLLDYLRPPEFKSQVIGALIRTGEYESILLYENDAEVVARITQDHGAQYVFHATWELDIEGV